MNVGLYSSTPELYRYAATHAPEVVLRTLAPGHPDITGLDALIVDDATAGLYHLAKAALGRGIDVYARPRQPLTVRQLVVLREATGRTGAALTLAQPWRRSALVAALRRAWRTAAPANLRYARLTRRTAADESLEGACFEELALAAGLFFESPPAFVSCRALREREGDAGALFMSLWDARGASVQCTVTALESGPEREALVVAGPRQFNLANTLSVTDADRPGRATPGTVRKQELTEASDSLLLNDAALFLAEPAARHAAADAGAWVQAALLWETARESMNLNGSPIRVPERTPLTRTNPPPLRLIQGGGSVSSVRTRRTLSLVP
jgi:hypothetical protein